MASNLNKSETPPVRRAKIKPGLKYQDMSPLGEKLHDLAEEIELSNEPAYSEEDIQRELDRRKGGFYS